MILTIASSILLASDKGLWVEKAPVGASPHLINHVGLEIDVERAGDVLARGCLGEERAEAIVAARRRALDEATIGLKDK
jgi:hypothetical protein